MRMLFNALCLLFSVSAMASPVATDDLFAPAFINVGDLSPDGSHLLAMTREENGRFLNVISPETGEMFKVSDLGKSGAVRQYYWIDNRSIFLAIHHNGSRSELVIEFERGEKVNSSYRLINAHGYVVSFLNNDKDEVLFAKHSVHEGGRDKLYLISRADLLKNNFDVARQIKTPRENVIEFYFDHVSEHLMVSLYDEEKDQIEWLGRKFRDRQWKLLFTQTDTDDLRRPIGWKDEQTFYVVSNEKTDKLSVHEFDLATQKLGKVVFQHEKYDVITGQVDPKTGQLLSVSYFDHGDLTTQYLQDDPDSRIAALDQTFAGQTWMVVAANERTSTYVLKTISSDKPPSYYFYRPEAKTVELISSAYPELEGIEFASTEVFTVNVGDDKEVEAYLSRPVSDQNHNTLLVVPHGGPIGVREYNLFSASTQFFTSRGYSVLRVNFRGSKGFGKEFLLSGSGQFGKLIESDISAAVKHTLDKYSFKNVCAMGSSYGGYSSFMLTLKNPQTYDCIVASYGVYDLPLLFNATNLIQNEHSQQAIEKVVGARNELLEEQSPIFSAADIEVPVLLIGGIDDPIADIEHSYRMEYLLNKNGKNVETLYYKDTGHGHSHWWGEWHENTFVDDFLQRTLGLQEKAASSQSKANLASDYLRLADSFHFDSLVDKDPDRAFHFFKKASYYGNARATYNLGSFYYDGYLKEKDVEKAKAYFEQASAQGYALADLVLADISTKGLLSEPDHHSAYRSIEQAVGKDTTANALQHQARYLCLGMGIEKDVDRCLTNLAMKQYEQDSTRKSLIFSKQSVASRHNVVADIMHAQTLTSDQGARLKDVLVDELNVNYFPFELDINDEGLFQKEGRKSKHLETTSDVPAVSGTRFGILFELDPEDSIPRYRIPHTGLYYIWTNKPKGEQEKIVHKDFARGYADGWGFTYTLDDKTLGTAEWNLYIYDLSGKLVKNKTFFVGDWES